jgi:hypothetical protein
MNFIKKILTILLLLSSIFIALWDYTYARDAPAECGSPAECAWTTVGDNNAIGDPGWNIEASGGRTITVIVTEQMPWLTCTPLVRDFGSDETGQAPTWNLRDAWEGNVNNIAAYRCEVPVWMEWALLVLW